MENSIQLRRHQADWLQLCAVQAQAQHAAANRASSMALQWLYNKQHRQQLPQEPTLASTLAGLSNTSVSLAQQQHHQRQLHQQASLLASDDLLQQMLANAAAWPAAASNMHQQPPSVNVEFNIVDGGAARKQQIPFVVPLHCLPLAAAAILHQHSGAASATRINDAKIKAVPQGLSAMWLSCNGAVLTQGVFAQAGCNYSVGQTVFVLRTQSAPAWLSLCRRSAHSSESNVSAHIEPATDSAAYVATRDIAAGAELVLYSGPAANGAHENGVQELSLNLVSSNAGKAGRVEHTSPNTSNSSAALSVGTDTTTEPGPLSPAPLVDLPVQKSDDLKSDCAAVDPNTVDNTSQSSGAGTGAGGYMCDRCGKVFTYRYYRDKHLKYTRCVDQGDRKYPCHLCSRSFEKRDRLRIHVLHVHEKHRPHVCSVCSKRFSQSSSLNKHLRVHSGERPYKCAFCTKAFTASSILRTHIRQHSGEKPFQCKYCGKSFASHAAHDSHVRRTHQQSNGGAASKPNPPPEVQQQQKPSCTELGDKKSAELAAAAQHKCAMCNAMFAHGTQLRFHAQLVHGL